MNRECGVVGDSITSCTSNRNAATTGSSSTDFISRGKGSVVRLCGHCGRGAGPSVRVRVQWVGQWVLGSPVTSEPQGMCVSCRMLTEDWV